MADILEHGDIYFIYRPRVDEPTAEGFADVQRFFVILSPPGKERHRLIIVGRKKLPEISDQHERNWGFVQKVGRRPEDVEDELEGMRYSTKTRGERHLSPARLAGEGVYAIVRHEDHTHIAYALELPRTPGSVQRELNIQKEASYILTVKNQEQALPPDVGLSDEQEPVFPAHLQARFRGRRFIPADPPEFLDQEGTEIILIGADEDVSEELGIRLNPERETIDTAEIFRNLHMEKSEHPLKPLFEGKWE
jgi:hypothetical protein